MKDNHPTIFTAKNPEEFQAAAKRFGQKIRDVLDRDKIIRGLNGLQRECELYGIWDEKKSVKQLLEELKVKRSNETNSNS